MDWEVYEVRWREIAASVEFNRLKMIRTSEGVQYAARVIVNGRVGFASADSEEKALEMAEKIAKVSEDKLEDFPNEKPRKVGGIYDRRVEKADADFLVAEIERLLSSVERAAIASAQLSYEVSEVRISNSFGLSCAEKSTYASLTFEVVYNDGSAYEICESRSVDLDIEDAAVNAEQLAIASSKARKIDSGFYDVVLMPIAVHQLFYYALYPSFSAENVVKGRSRLNIGDKIGCVTLIDDPTLHGGLMSCSFDDEGVASRRTVLVEEGIVKGYYSDWKYGKIVGEVTGNGFREEESLPPSPAPSNVIVEVDNRSDVDNALVVHTLIGAHTANPISGDFSLECLNAELDGEAVKGVMIYGNVFDLLGSISGYAGDVRQVENTVTPPLRVSKLRVV